MTTSGTNERPAKARFSETRVFVSIRGGSKSLQRYGLYRLAVRAAERGLRSDSLKSEDERTHGIIRDAQVHHYRDTRRG
jgi:hypothetical protein